MSNTKITPLLTPLKDMNCHPIHIGDKFRIPREPNCDHYFVICEVRESDRCLSGYGLFDIKTNHLISNAEIASGYTKIN